MMKKPSAPFKTCNLKDDFNKATRKIGSLLREGRLFRSMGQIGMETIRDLPRPGEIFALAAAVMVPGGFFAYAGYRIVRHEQLKARRHKNPGA